MKQLDPASTGRTYERAGAQFICGSGGCDAKTFSSPRPERAIAGQLLEETGAWWRAIRDLQPEHEVPLGIPAAIEAAYQASLGWVEWLDRKATP